MIIFLKKLFQKLVVRLGFEAIAAFVPESGPIRRMMVNIRQVQGIFEKIFLKK